MMVAVAGIDAVVAAAAAVVDAVAAAVEFAVVAVALQRPLSSDELVR